jgi:predicted peptidase
MNMKLFLRFVSALVSVSLLVGCTSPTPTSAPQSVLENTPSPIPSPTETIEPTMTAEPSATAEPANSPAPSSNVETGQHAFFSEKAQRNYLLFLPANYGKDPQKQWPLILSLHGSGTRGKDIDNLKYEALPQILEFTPDFPFVVLSPQLTDADNEDFWVHEKVMDSVFTLLDEIQSTYPVDPKRVYLTGVSIGGNGTWAYGLKYPKRFAALVPVMGFFGDTSGFFVPDNICDLKDVPIWAFHGAQDPIVPLDAEQSIVDALKACGGNVQFTVYPDGDHDISGRVYNNNLELFEWLSSQSLK